MPEMRGPPSARTVAIVLCFSASNSSRTRAAKAGSAASTSLQLAMPELWHGPPTIPALGRGPRVKSEHILRGGKSMPEAVIVAAARSPIGRAFKGSLTTIRPDDLAVQMVRAALAQVPQLDPTEIDDLALGCGLPGGEQGFNMARVVAVLLGYDTLPGTTVNRYCSSSLQTTRMAMHAIRAGEGDVFVSAGVETVSRFAKGNSDSWPDTHNPIFADAEDRHAARRGERRRRLERSARRRAPPRHLHRDGADRGEPGPAQGRHPRGHGPLRRALAEPRREGDRQRVLRPGDHPGHAARRHGRQRR